MADRDLTSYRKATVQDRELLTRLRILFLEEIRSEPKATIDMSEAIGSYFDRTIPRGEFVAYLAIRNDQVVGVGGMAVCELPPIDAPRPRRRGYVLNMYTTPAARRTGIARRIVGLLVAEARNLGLSHVHLRATEKGIDLYRQAGFSEPGFVEMELALDPALNG